jgi:hypothetical protein
MALRHDANDANLGRIADDLIGIRELLDKMDHAQDALLQNGQSLQGQLEALRRDYPYDPGPDPGEARTGRTIPRRPSRPHPDPAIQYGRPAALDQRRPDAARTKSGTFITTTMTGGSKVRNMSPLFPPVWRPNALRQRLAERR